MVQKLNQLKESPSQTAGPYVHIGCVPNFCGIEGVYPNDLGDAMVNADTQGERITVSEAVVVVQVGDERMMSVSESRDREADADQGPVNALSRALAKDLGPYQAHIADIDLVDFRVRITNGGTEAVTRVHIDSQDSTGRTWSTVGVSANIVDASFQALLDAVTWKLISDGVAPV